MKLCDYLAVIGILIGIGTMCEIVVGDLFAMTIGFFALFVTMMLALTTAYFDLKILELKKFILEIGDKNEKGN